MEIMEFVLTAALPALGLLWGSNKVVKALKLKNRMNNILTWPKCKGTIRTSEPASYNEKNDIAEYDKAVHTDLAYSYTVNDTEYTGHGICREYRQLMDKSDHIYFSNIFKEGNSVDVYFNPNNLQESYINPLYEEKVKKNIALGSVVIIIAFGFLQNALPFLFNNLGF